MAGLPLDASSGASGVVSLRRRLWQPWPTVLLVAFATGNSLRLSADSFRWVFWATMATVVTVSVGSTLRWGTDLTPTSLVSRWGRRRAIPWDRVQGFHVQELFGWRTLQVISDDGKYTALWAPSTTGFIGRARFDAEQQLIGQWWVDHRGPQWKPMPVNRWGAPPAPLPDAGPPAAPSPSASAADASPSPRDNPWTTLKRFT